MTKLEIIMLVIVIYIVSFIITYLFMRKDYKRYHVNGYLEPDTSDIILAILLIIIPLYNTFMAIAFIVHDLADSYSYKNNITCTNILDKFYLIKRR